MGVYIKARFNYDPDALAFIQASSIPETTQKLAINQLVLDLKAYGLWSKMKAIYPMVGGSAFYHKWNLKDPRDLDAAFRLVFSGGWTHSATGALPGGVNGYADTKLATNNMGLNSIHYSYYSRSDTAAASMQEMGALQNPGAIPGNSYSDLAVRNTSGAFIRLNNGGGVTFVANTDSRGFYTGTRTGANTLKLFKNGSSIQSLADVTSLSSTIFTYIGALNLLGSPASYSNRECAFSSIGDGLTDTEAANYYTVVQNFQIALGRSIGPQTVSDPDAQAFVTAANIEDQVQAQAVNQLVIDMKAANIWTKMKAVYPMVGGTAASHKWNLKDPQDTNAAFRLVFNGGWTHSSTGATPNGTNAFANTYLSPSTQLLLTSTHLSYYSRTNVNLTQVEIGSQSGTAYTMIEARTANTSYFLVNTNSIGGASDTNSAAFYIANRTASNVNNGFRNNVKIANFTFNADALPVNNIYIGALNNLTGSAQYYTTKECAFASLGTGLTDTEAANFYTMVQTFNTTLNRQV